MATEMPIKVITGARSKLPPSIITSSREFLFYDREGLLSAKTKKKKKKKKKKAGALMSCKTILPLAGYFRELPSGIVPIPKSPSS